MLRELLEEFEKNMDDVFVKEGFGDDAKRFAKNAGKAFSKKFWWDGFESPKEMQAKIKDMDDRFLIKLYRNPEEEPEANKQNEFRQRLINREVKRRFGVKPGKVNEVDIDHDTQKPVDGNVPSVTLEPHVVQHLRRLESGRDFAKTLAHAWKGEYGEVTARKNGYRHWAQPLIANSHLEDDQKAEAANDLSKISSRWEEVDQMPDTNKQSKNMFAKGYATGKKKRGKRTNESASCGATGAGSIAGAVQPMGSLRKRTEEEIGPVNSQTDIESMLADMKQTGGGTMRFLVKGDSVTYQIEKGRWNNGNQTKIHGSQVEEETGYVNAGKGLKKNQKPPHATMKTPVKTYMGSADKKVGG